MEPEYHKLGTPQRATTENTHKLLRPPGVGLAERHVKYLEDRGVTLKVARAAGYWTASKPSEIPSAFATQRRRHPTLIAPHLSPDMETVSWQKHDDRPRMDKGKPVKWASPKREKVRTVLSVHPWMLEEVRSGAKPLWVCEGLTRGHALAPFGIPAVTYAGCYAWQKDGDPLACWEHVNLAGRLVYDVPDADARTNSQVQDTQATRVRYLESRGARVLVVRVPEVGGDEHAGLDDYLAADGDLEALIRDARPYVRVEVGRERLKRDEPLRLGVAMLRRGVEALESRKGAECTALSIARHLVEKWATTRGKPTKRGIEVSPSVRQVAAGVRVGVGTVSRAFGHLEDEEGFLEKIAPSQGTKPASYLLLYPSGGGSEFVEHMEEQGASGKEGQEQVRQEETSLSERESSPSVLQTRGVVKSVADVEKLPPLRNSKLVHTWARKNGRRVVVDSHFVWRYGKKREEIARYVIERAGADETKIHEKFGSPRSRLREFRRVWLQPMLNDGVLLRDGGRILPSPEWPKAVERVQAQTDEETDNRLQDARIADQQKAFRQAKDRPTDPTPELAGPEKVREIVARAEERDHAARVEEQRRKVGTTPETFIADALQDASGFGWRELAGAVDGEGR